MENSDFTPPVSLRPAGSVRDKHRARKRAAPVPRASTGYDAAPARGTAKTAGAKWFDMKGNDDADKTLALLKLRGSLPSGGKRRYYAKSSAVGASGVFAVGTVLPSKFDFRRGRRKHAQTYAQELLADPSVKAGVAAVRSKAMAKGRAGKKRTVKRRS